MSNDVRENIVGGEGEYERLAYASPFGENVAKRLAPPAEICSRKAPPAWPLNERALPNRVKMTTNRRQSTYGPR